jgi:hypothetical protein
MSCYACLCDDNITREESVREIGRILAALPIHSLIIALGLYRDATLHFPNPSLYHAVPSRNNHMYLQ